MNLDEQLGTALDIPAVFVDPDQRRAELLADILALARPGGGIDAAAFQTRPSVLRRVAALLAAVLPERVDRLVTDPAGVALATAVALHTGLPFAVLDQSNLDIMGGDMHRGEQVTVLEPVITGGTRSARIIDRVHAEGARVAGILGVIDCAGDHGDSDIPVNALFHLPGNPVTTTGRKRQS